MELNNEFTVSVPVAQAWSVLTDLERIAPCLPGAELQEVEGDEYRGVVKVKVGPITAQYKGVASFQERDGENHRAVIKAEGRDTRGQGNASALITARLEAVGEGTKVVVDTDLTVTGKVAQMGRGVMADVSAKLMGQFVEALEADVLSSTETEIAATAAEAAAEAQVETAATAADAQVETAADSPAPAPAEAKPATSTGPRKIESRPAEPVDLLDAGGMPVLKRVGPVLGALFVVAFILLRRRKK